MDILEKLKRIDKTTQGLTIAGVTIWDLIYEIEHLRNQNEAQRALLIELLHYPVGFAKPEAEKPKDLLPGQQIDILIKDYVAEGRVTGVTVWADPEMRKLIESVPGVTLAVSIKPTEYSVHFDPRFDPETIKANIFTRLRGAQELRRKVEKSR